MVHTAKEVDNLDELVSVKNIPFELVPRELIEQIRPYADPPTYEQWLAWCPYFNKMPNYWNIALVDKDSRIVAFQYGTWDPCGAEMQIIRSVIRPEYFRVSGKVLKRGVEDVRRLARELGMRRIYWITCRWKAFLRKLPGDAQLMEARVLEVTNVKGNS
jgi:hypothetical protein